MNAPRAELLEFAYRALERLNAADGGSVDPDHEAQLLREFDPTSKFRFLPHRDNFDNSTAWALLIIADNGETTTMSWTPPHNIPWSLRGTHTRSESTLLTVNGVELSVEEAIWHLDILWEEAALLRKLIDVCLVRAELAASPVHFTDDQLQESMDAFRRSRGLLTSAATQQWMREHGLDHRSLEQLVEYEASVAVLRQRHSEQADISDQRSEFSFDRWLAGQRRECRIEWHWGESAKTAGIATSTR
ncbi:TIGR04500 family putative peptide maturation system protein [Rhodococcus sp. 5A-K4]|jgi:putative peptide maturation system protein|uniref:TIGR04500 family putative peptide maturation system protein n=1 Tax=Rhodococcus sp. 5A-K4 TaxID=3384442 RepID=UPI0038D4143A